MKEIRTGTLVIPISTWGNCTERDLSCSAGEGRSELEVVFVPNTQDTGARKTILRGTVAAFTPGPRHPCALCDTPIVLPIVGPACCSSPQHCPIATNTYARGSALFCSSMKALSWSQIFPFWKVFRVSAWVKPGSPPSMLAALPTLVCLPGL